MTDRDHFAAAALTGLLSNVQRYQNEPLTRQAFEIADFMLRERERTNLDASPEAKADLPDERPPNAVSANGGTPCAAGRDGSGTGDTQEPVAWAIERGDGGSLMGFCHTKREATRFAHAIIADTKSEHFMLRHVPLYRQPQPTLTDAEREVIEWAANAMRPDCRAILRGLLERTK